MQDMLLKIVALGVTATVFADRWLLGRSVDHWLKRGPITDAYIWLEARRESIRLLHAASRTYLRLVDNVLVAPFATPLKQGSKRMWTRLFTLLWFAGLIYSLVIFSGPLVKPLHCWMCSRIITEFRYKLSPPVGEFLAIEAINQYASSQNSTAYSLFHDHNLMEVARQLMPPPGTTISLHKDKYMEWREQPYAVKKYGPAGLDTGVRIMVWCGSVVGIGFAIIAFCVTRSIAKRITETERGSVIVVLWLADLAAAIVLAIVATAVTYSVVGKWKLGGTEEVFVAMATLFVVPHIVLCSLQAHFLLNSPTPRSERGFVYQ